MKLRFVSRNEHKIREVQSLLTDTGITIVPLKESIEELQTENAEKLVLDKLYKAFKLTGHPVFVEHTGLFIKAFNDFPGGLTQVFWDRLEADNFCKLLDSFPDKSAFAQTMIGYCDGKRTFTFIGKLEGIISQGPKGPRGFQWDCIFIPKGDSRTFAEMGDEKNLISMRKLAFDQFKDFLSKERR